jgi:transcriptional regulator with GAF, ATPase, and Fis domain
VSANDLPTELTFPHVGRVERLEGVAGGGAGTVLRGWLGPQTVGVKIGHDDGDAIATGVVASAADRLSREAIARALSGIGRPIDGRRPDREHGRPMLLFEWVEGAPADLSRRAPEEFAAVIDAVARDVAEGLARLHAVGFRHGDVKRSNVVVATDTGAPVRAALVDFGLAAPFAEPLSGGTLAALPPEIREDPAAVGRAGPELDVYAYGLLLRALREEAGLDPHADPRVTRALSPRPGERPPAAALAGLMGLRLPLDAAYLATRLSTIERLAKEGRAPPSGRAGVWVMGLVRALAGLSGTRAAGAPIPPMSAAERRTLVRRVAVVDHARLLRPSSVARGSRAGGRESQDDELLARLAGEEQPHDEREDPVEAVVASLAVDPGDRAALGALGRLAAGAPARIAASPLAGVVVRLLRRAGAIEPALSVARAVVAQRPDDDDARLDLAEVTRLAGDPAGALELARAPGLATPTDRSVRLRALLARLAIDARDHAAAERHLEGAPVAEPAVAEARALLSWSQGAHDVGLAAIDAAEPDDPERSARLSLVRGMLLHGRGDAEGAAAAFAAAAFEAATIGAFPLEATARANEAAAAHDAGRLAAAIEAARRASELLSALGRHADEARARLNFAAALAACGSFEEARAEAARVELSAVREGDRRTAAYARLVEVDAALEEPDGRDEAASASVAAARLLGEAATTGDRLQALAYLALARRTLSAAEAATGAALARRTQDGEARRIWARAVFELASAETAISVALEPERPVALEPERSVALEPERSVALEPERYLDELLRDRDAAPAASLGPLLVAAVAYARHQGRGDAARSLATRASRLVERIEASVPVDRRAAFAARRWVRFARDGAELVSDLGLAPAQIDLLSSIARGLRDRTSLGDLLRQVVDGLVLWVGVERGLLLLRASDPSVPGGARLVPRVARGLSRDDLRGEQLALSTSLAARALERLEPVVAVDASGDGRDPVSASVHALRLRSVLAVPLVARGEALGVVYLDDRIRRGAFGPAEIAWVKLLATQAAAALADARDALRLRRLARRAERAQRRLEETLAKTEGALEVARVALAAHGDPHGSDPRGTRHPYPAIVGDGAAIRRTLALVDRVTDAADARVPVLIVGESGTGKELVARAIHDNGPRRARPFVAENCGAIPEPLLESTLFGHVRGAFTGADRPRAGLFEIANAGTLFLDEVGEMGLAMQAKLLRVLQEGEVRPVGGERVTKVDVRVIAATHRDLEALVREGRFREDLYYRLAVVPLALPPLRERPEDVPALVTHFVARWAGGRRVRVSREALALLASAPWPGNVRQLENELRRALVLCDDLLDVEHLSPELVHPIRAGRDGAVFGLRAQVDALERRLVVDALRRASGNQTHAARALGVSRFGLQKMIKRLGLSKGSTPHD